MFSCNFWEIFKNTFFLKNTSSGCFWPVSPFILMYSVFCSKNYRTVEDVETKVDIGIK